MHVSVGIPEDHGDEILTQCQAVGEAADIRSMAGYETAKATYAVMDASVPAGDLHSPAARYLQGGWAEKGEPPCPT